jgi:Cu(I)/Ag(I) efflux system membrane protein CusA/SilA
MAKVILGGLLTSTFLNGFIIPIMYILTNKKIVTEVIKNDEV